MNRVRHTAIGLIAVVALTVAAGCTTEPVGNSNTRVPAPPSPSASTPAVDANQATAVPVTLPVLDALFSDEGFKTKLKSSMQLSDEQLAQLQKIASDEVDRLRESNIEEQSGEPAPQAEQSRQRAAEAIRGVVGEQKAAELFALARDYWVSGSEPVSTGTTSDADTGPSKPNAIPKDTRVVVNIPAYRMDVFQDGSLIKSYKIGIGYPEFPLPTGLRKAQSIIFNPTWTPPDEPWVAKMKNVAVGEKVAAGSKLNPLGPIKIPIGLPSLIHGGKSPAKLGTFASHGCVGLTTPQVQDFSRLLAQAGGTELTEAAINSYFKDKTKTQSVKLDKAVPVELRYETIVVEDGKLHIYRDVYDQDTNTEENLRKVLEANGIQFEDLSEAEREQVLGALNAMSRQPGSAASKPAASASPAGSSRLTTDKTEKTAEAKSAKPLKPAKPIGKNQKEVVIELAALKGKGYPAAVKFDTGSGKPAALAAVRSSR